LTVLAASRRARFERYSHMVVEGRERRVRIFSLQIVSTARYSRAIVA
jgi:hypothetical protein